MGKFAMSACSRPLRSLVTLGALITTRPDPTIRNGLPNCLYIVRDGDAVLYVGQTTKSVRRRIKDHIIAAPWGDHLGMFYKQHQPRSSEWTIEVFYIVAHLHDAENEAIERLRPILNKQRPERKITPSFELALEATL